MIKMFASLILEPVRKLLYMVKGKGALQMESRLITLSVGARTKHVR